MAKQATGLPEVRRCVDPADHQCGWVALHVPASRSGWLVSTPDGAHWATGDEVKGWKVLT